MYNNKKHTYSIGTSHLDGDAIIVTMQALSKAFECNKVRAVELEVFLAYVHLELAHVNVGMHVDQR